MTPMFFQLVIDKVLVHQSYATLTVSDDRHRDRADLRRHLHLPHGAISLLYATNRIDIRIATRTFGHLLNLPIALFEQASAGVIVKHMQQTGRIREFLTGRLFLTLLDGLSLLVFIPILLLYSVKLTFVVLGFAASCRLGGDGAGRAVPTSFAGALQGRRRPAGPACRNRSRHAYRQVACPGATPAQGLG
jgi:subfamily B ATP-binding cassette protein HlyB/CyaB